MGCGDRPYSHSYSCRGGHATLLVLGFLFLVHRNVNEVRSSHWLNKLHRKNPRSPINGPKLPALVRYKKWCVKVCVWQKYDDILRVDWSNCIKSSSETIMLGEGRQVLYMQLGHRISDMSAHQQFNCNDTKCNTVKQHMKKPPNSTPFKCPHTTHQNPVCLFLIPPEESPSFSLCNHNTGLGNSHRA